MKHKNLQKKKEKKTETNKMEKKNKKYFLHTHSPPKKDITLSSLPFIM